MEKIKFTIEDIEKCFNELGFEWVDRYVYNTKNKEYERARMSHFKKSPTFVYLKNKCCVLTLVTITNEKFIIGHEHVEKLDASLLWNDILEDKSKQEIN